MFVKVGFEEDPRPMTLSMEELTREYIQELFNDEYPAIEEEFEKALRGGKHGIKIIRDQISRKMISVSPDPEVGYGLIYVVFAGKEK